MSRKNNKDTMEVDDKHGRRQFIRTGAAFLMVGAGAASAQEEGNSEQTVTVRVAWLGKTQRKKDQTAIRVPPLIARGVAPKSRHH